MTRTRWLALALFVSLGINLFIGGLAIGRWVDDGWHGHGGGPHHMRAETPDGPGPRWLRRMVGEDGMAIVTEVWQRHEAVIDPLRADARAARSVVAESLSDEPFDRAAYEQALAGMRATMDRMQAATHAAVTDVVAAMTPEQRAAFAARVREWEQRRRPPPPEK